MLQSKITQTARLSPDPGTMRIHSVSQILLYHEMSQHISYKRDYPSLKVKEGGREPLKGDRETEGGKSYTRSLWECVCEHMLVQTGKCGVNIN